MTDSKRATRTLNGWEVESITEYYRAGGDMNTTQLAKRYYVDPRTIRNVCNRAGVPYPGKKNND